MLLFSLNIQHENRKKKNLNEYIYMSVTQGYINLANI